MDMSQTADQTLGAAPQTARWRTHLLGWGIVLAAMAAAYWPTLTSLVFIWNNNVSYEYCFLIVPIIVWLVWERRKELIYIAPSPSLWGVVALFGSLVLWLLGDAGHINLIQHAALIFMLQSSVLAVFGWQVLRALLFPVVFAAFMIPAGEQFIPPLQQVTAWFCIKLLALFGVPFTTDGLFIHVPNGTFEVAEACSGIRYLTTMVALGSVYAVLCFKSTLRRVAVMVLAVAFPIIANGIRAWGIIYLAYMSDNRIATGIDHILYGWVFFVLVMLIFIAALWKFADRPIDMPAIDLTRYKMNAEAPARPLFAAVVAVGVAAIAGAALFGHWMQNRAATFGAPVVATPQVAGWSHSDHAERVDFTPIYKGASQERRILLSDGEGRFIQVYVAAYDRQTADREMVAYGNGAFQNAVEERVNWVWTGNEVPLPLAGSALPDGFTVYMNNAVRDVWQWYYVNGKVLTSPTAAKFEAARARLFGGRTDAATLVLSSERIVNQVSQAPHLQKFAEAMGPVDKIFSSWISFPAAPKGQ